MDDEGSLHVVEALLAGLIILTAVLFLTNVSKPSPPAAESGIDLEGVARDLLVVLENRPAVDDACTESPQPDPCYPSMLDEVVGHALGFDVDEVGRDDSNSEAESFLRQVVPVGNRWLLRLDNGVEPLVLLPTSGSNVQLTPRAAKAAETFILPPWQAWSDDCGAPPAASEVFSPGQSETNAAMKTLDVVASDRLYAPMGTLPPAPFDSADTWADWWVAQQALAEAREAGIQGFDDLIPPTAPYGWWWLDADGDFGVTSDECYFVGLPDGTATDYPAYGVQLVVWPIAG